MRRVRMVIGIATTAVALASAGPPFAKTEEKHFFGECGASVAAQTIAPATPVTAKGLAEVDELAIAGVHIECAGLKGTAEAEEERSTSLKMKLTFKKCSHPDRQGAAGLH